MKKGLFLTVMLVSVLALGFTQNVPTFPSGFVGTWKRDNFNNTLTFTTTALKASNQTPSWILSAVSGDSYTYYLDYNPSWVGTGTIKLVNGDLVISGDSGDGENNWNGTWKKQTSPTSQTSQSSFPLGFVGIWKRDNFNNTLTLSTTTLSASNQNRAWFFYSVSGDSYTIYPNNDYAARIRDNPSWVLSQFGTTINIKLLNGDLVISGDSGTGEDNWNGTWKKQTLASMASQSQQLQNGITVTGRISSGNGSVWYSVTPAVNGYVAIAARHPDTRYTLRLEIYDTQFNLLTFKEEAGEFELVMPAEMGNKYMIKLRPIDFYEYSSGDNYRITAIIEAFDPNLTPNSGDDFDIIQNAQGGITITGYRSARRQVVIPATISGIRITEIAKDVFNGKKLYSVVIPESVTSIGQSAFYNNNLTSVTIPNRVTTIGSSAFSYNNLTSVTIPNSVTTIGSGAFSYNKLTSVTIPNSVTTIGSSAFKNNALTSITIPNSVTSIGSEAFCNNSLASITFGNRVETIDTGAFANNKLTELTNLPSSVRIIGTGAFYNNSITIVTLPSNSNLALESGSILSGNYFDKPVFANNPITTLVIPAALTQTSTRSIGYVGSSNIGEALGNSLRTLTTITMPANAPMGSSQLIQGLPNNFAQYYVSQNRKAGTYSWDGRLWSVR